MTERDSVRFGDTTIDYRVRRSDRRKKTVQITVDGSGVEVAAPATTAGDELRGIVRKRATWIVTHSTGQTLEAAPKRFVSGETLPYLGRNVRLVVEPTNARSLGELLCQGWGEMRLGGVVLGLLEAPELGSENGAMARQQRAGRSSSYRYSEVERAQAVRLVRALRAELGTDFGTVRRVADQLGFGVESVRKWVRQADIDDGDAAGTTTVDRARIRELESENRELRRANAILRSHRFSSRRSSTAH